MVSRIEQSRLDYVAASSRDDCPAILEFHHGADAGRITITMPGMGTYHGVRAEHFDESLILPV